MITGCSAHFKIEKFINYDNEKGFISVVCCMTLQQLVSLGLISLNEIPLAAKMSLIKVKYSLGYSSIVVVLVSLIQP